MNNTPEINDIDPTILTAPVRQALDAPTAEIIQWERDSIRYINTEKSNLGLYRFRGTANVDGQARPWSVVLKAVRAPLHDADPPSGIITAVKSLPTRTVSWQSCPAACWRRAVWVVLNIRMESAGCGWRTSWIPPAKPGRWMSIDWLPVSLAGSMERISSVRLCRFGPGSVDIGCRAGWHTMSKAAGTL